MGTTDFFLPLSSSLSGLGWYMLLYSRTVQPCILISSSDVFRARVQEYNSADWNAKQAWCQLCPDCNFNFWINKKTLANLKHIFLLNSANQPRNPLAVPSGHSVFHEAAQEDYRIWNQTDQGLNSWFSICYLSLSHSYEVSETQLIPSITQR